MEENASNKGFTLAEVLITLAIIGIVAALTIPAVVRNYRETQYKTQVKKAFTTLQQAINKTNYDFGATPRCYIDYSGGGDSQNVYYNSECPAFYKTLRDNMKIIKYCNGNAYANGCVPDYNPSTTSSATVNGFSSEWIKKHDPVWVLADGTIIISYVGTHPLMAFDINGKKGPNKFGYDLFALSLTKDNNKGVIITNLKIGGEPIETGGKSLFDMLKWAYE